ncbi:MAG: type II secretion system protein GspL [Sphingobium sp.]
MSVNDALIVALPQAEDDEPVWLRIADGAIVGRGVGANWLAASGLAALPDKTTIMLLPPPAQVALHWAVHPDMPVRQARAAARVAVLAAALAPADQLFAVTDRNEDPARPHIVALAARADMQHWLLWAQHHGLDPDIIVPPPLLLPEPEDGPESSFVRGEIGGTAILRGRDIAFVNETGLALLRGEAPVRDIAPDAIETAMLAALARPPLDMRQGDFAKRVRRPVDVQILRRIALWCGLILLASLSIALIGIGKAWWAARDLDEQSVVIARQVLPQATDAVAAEAELDARLAARGAGGRGFTAPAAALLASIQDVPGVSLTSLSRDPDGTVRAALTGARVEDVNGVLVALQAAGFTVSVTSSQDPGGRTLADIMVRS